MQILNILTVLSIILHSTFSTIVNDDQDIFILNLTMKNYQSSTIDQIIYLPYKIPDEEWSVIGYRPLAHMNKIHHMDIFACETLPFEQSFWEGKDGEICGSGAQQILYGWDRDALDTHFPKDTGIAIGKNTLYKYLLLNIHYLPIVKNDYSGNQLIISRKRTKYLAGVVLAGTNDISIPPKSRNVKTSFSCQYHGAKLSIFAAGVHSHRWGRVISLYRLRNGATTLIIKGNPKQIHHSNRLSSPIEIFDGDYLIGQCIYDNDDDQLVQVGPTHDGEMCNIMAAYSYSAAEDQQMSRRVPFDFCWENSFPHLIEYIPLSSEIPPKTSFDMLEKDQNILIHKKKLLLICLMMITALVIGLVLVLIIRHFQNYCSKQYDGYHRIKQENELEIE